MSNLKFSDHSVFTSGPGKSTDLVLNLVSQKGKNRLCNQFEFTADNSDLFCAYQVSGDPSIGITEILIAARLYGRLPGSPASEFIIRLDVFEKEDGEVSNVYWDDFSFDSEIDMHGPSRMWLFKEKGGLNPLEYKRASAFLDSYYDGKIKSFNLSMPWEASFFHYSMYL